MHWILVLIIAGGGGGSQQPNDVVQVEQGPTTKAICELVGKDAVRDLDLAGKKAVFVCVRKLQ